MIRLQCNYDTITVQVQYHHNVGQAWETESAAWRAGTGLYEYSAQRIQLLACQITYITITLFGYDVGDVLSNGYSLLAGSTLHTFAEVIRGATSTDEIANDIDKEYKSAFNDAQKFGVKILCYDCKLSNKEIKLNNQINYE